MKPLAALVLPVAFLAWAAWPRSDPVAVGACDAVPAADLGAVLPRPVGPGAEGSADGSRRDATVCSYRAVTVFAVGGGGRDLYERTTAAIDGITRLGPDAAVVHHVFAPGDSRGDTDSLWLVRGDTYLNVLLREAPDGAVEALARRLVG